MGKKFKPGKKQITPEEQEKVANKESSGHMGIAEKSKKIKKKNRKNLTEINNVPIDTEAGNKHSVIKKKNKAKKHKATQSKENAVETKSEVEVNGNGSEPADMKKSKKDETKVIEQSAGNNQEQKKKHKKKKVSVEVKPEDSADGKGLDVTTNSKKKKKRKATLDEDDQPKKHKKIQHSTDQVDGDAKGNGIAVPVSVKTLDGKVPKKHKKKNKQQNHTNGVNEESQPNKPELKIKAKNKKQQVKIIEADRDVVTSESDSEDEQNDASNEMDKVNQSILNQHAKADEDESSGDDEANKKGQDTKVDEKKKEPRFTGPEHSIFIGNLPVTVKKSTMKNMYKQYGQILTIRFRSSDGVTLFKKKDRKEAKSLNCYIRFETRKEAEAACVTNGQLVEGNRLRVTMHNQKQMGHTASTVFVGNISRKTTDNELYDFFSRVGELEYVRQIADKGIGYVCFKKGVSIAKALKLNQQLLNGRPLRIVKVDPTKQGKRKNKKGNLVDKAKFSHPGSLTNQPKNDKNQQRHGDQKQKPPVREFHGTVTKNKSDNKYKQNKKKGGSDKKKKLLAQKLTAAGTSRKK